MKRKDAEKLLEKYHQGYASREEVLLLELWYAKRVLNDIPPLEEEDKRIKEEIWNQLKLKNNRMIKPKHRLIYKIAAAAFILIAFTLDILFYQSSSNKQHELLLTALVELDDLLPGNNKATLTFSDGNSIDLNENQDGIVIYKDEIRYRDGTAIPANQENDFTVLSTPNGGQYQIVLPDGTKVWLNAASSLKYPEKFSDDVRRVELTGEAYFEVKKIPANDKKKPRFIVRTASQEVEVFGTHFNINSYHEESSTQTTLIEGTVKVSLLNNGSVSSNDGIILHPNQQSSLKKNKSQFQVNNIDPSASVAWKDGLFQFDHADIESVMRQLARWYDVEVVYEGRRPTGEFTGKMYRSMKASSVLEGLSSLGVKFRIEGNTIVVIQS